MIASYLCLAEAFITLTGEILPQHIQRSPFRQLAQHIKPTRAHAARLIVVLGLCRLRIITARWTSFCLVVLGSSGGWRPSCRFAARCTPNATFWRTQKPIGVCAMFEPFYEQPALDPAIGEVSVDPRVSSSIPGICFPGTNDARCLGLWTRLSRLCNPCVEALVAFSKARVHSSAA